VQVISVEDDDVSVQSDSPKAIWKVDGTSSIDEGNPEPKIVID
jgi:hypothetical protein